MLEFLRLSPPIPELSLVGKRAKLPVIRLHDLRHTHATLATRGRRDRSRWYRERLGPQYRPAFTMTVYQHVLPGMQREAVQNLVDELADATPKAARRLKVVGA